MDAPSRVELVSPEEDANVSSEVVFEWNSSTVALGYPCSDSVALQGKLVVIVANLTTGEEIFSKAFTGSDVEAGVAKWDASNELGRIALVQVCWCAVSECCFSCLHRLQRA